MAKKVMIKVAPPSGDPTPKDGTAPSVAIPPFGGATALNAPSEETNETPNTIKLTDNRSINPASGRPFKVKGTKGINADVENIKAIISHAKAKGVDPRTALAIGLQESELGRLDPNFGNAYSYEPDPDIYEKYKNKNLDDPELVRNINANKLAKALKDKFAYAAQLRSKGIIPHGEEYDIQTYNGLGVLKPGWSTGGQANSYYEVPVSPNQPLDLKKNPAYGKIVKQLRDEVIGSNPEIMKLIASTPAYGQTAPLAPKIMLRTSK